ncbi:MAG: hypothetical protein HJJLKODD_02152 [Phycisphaerae bacterium]|nr:hypothetical protein [Phycisphaerae bacterium]
MALLPITVIGLMTAHLRQDDADRWLYAYIGEQMRQGQELYGDVWDNKPPMIFWINYVGLLISGGQYFGVALMCTISIMVSLWLFHRVAAHWFGNPAAHLGTVLAALYLLHPLYWGGTNRPETFLIMFDLAAVRFFQLCIRARAGLRCAFVAGMALAGSFLCKQTGLATTGAIFVTLLIILLIDRPKRRPHVLMIIAGAGGYAIALGFAVIILLLTADGHWAWIAIVEFPRLHSQQNGFPPSLHWIDWSEHLAVLGLPAILAAAFLFKTLLGWFNRSLISSPEAADSANPIRPQSLHDSSMKSVTQHPILVTTIWLIFALYFILISPGKSNYYFISALPPLLLLAVGSIRELLREQAAWNHLQRSALRCLMLLWVVYMLIAPIRAQWRAVAVNWTNSQMDTDPYQVRGKLQQLQHYLQPGDSIQSLSYQPAFYWFTGFRSGSRFTSLLNISQLGSKSNILVEQMVHDWQSHPPEIILISAEEVNRELSRIPSPDSADLRPLMQFIHDRYEPLPEPDNQWGMVYQSNPIMSP